MVADRARDYNPARGGLIAQCSSRQVCDSNIMNRAAHQTGWIRTRGAGGGRHTSVSAARRRSTGLAVLFAAGMLMLSGRLSAADDLAELCVMYADALPDSAARRTDPGADGAFDPQLHRLVELRDIIVGKWAPFSPEVDLFIGEYASAGKFARLDVVLDGLMNPPGPTDWLQFYPFTYGAHPVYGFIEVDMDSDIETGGELDAPEYRYVGNVVRFGGKPPVADLEDRTALDASAFDGDFLSPPYVDRSGEEFHLALLGSVFESTDILEVAGNGDGVFDAGEVWWIDAPWFHRAHGYEQFSLASGGAYAGEYAPRCTVQFEHDPIEDVTLISLVFPLKNSGAGLMWGEPPEAPNGDPSDHFSVFEALKDLHDSAVFLETYPTGLPEEIIIAEWVGKDAEEYLAPVSWQITALLGTSYTAADATGEYFVWTDVYPDVFRGDANGDTEADQQDRSLIAQFISNRDANDGKTDGRVELLDFGLDFSVFDVNHSGVVDELDILLVSSPGDADGDEDIDLLDLVGLQRCFSGAGVPIDPLVCGLADFDADGDIDGDDTQRFMGSFTGTGGQ